MVAAGEAVAWTSGAPADRGVWAEEGVRAVRAPVDRRPGLGGQALDDGHCARAVGVEDHRSVRASARDGEARSGTTRSG